MKIRRILYPTDFSEASKAAMTAACELADKFEAELHVLHVLHDLASLMPFTAIAIWTDPDHIAEISDKAKHMLAEIPDANWSKGKDVLRKIEVGNVAYAITTYAHLHCIDLIVIGTHGHSGLMHALLGSTAEKVVRTAECPVLTVPSKTAPAIDIASMNPQSPILD